MCASSASGGADCSAPPTCSGDAISCAILSQQWQTRCDLQKDADSSITLGKQMQVGNDPMAAQLPTPDKATQIDMSQRFASVDDMGFAAQCMSDINLSLALPGGPANVHFDMSPMCDIGKLLGYLNMLGTMMLCAYMLKGSF
ncbi:virulence factor TspB C-terminal domain-related protein [Ralstonia syzygii]|uniref:virulence factor TspB C-terminal domain-related protein n=1 Tax=Ralstonia syzygii TaxID=28097 RepID=UPI001E4334D2|nr:virulence factor TspB C-terminal domain-related protein [Ralstonia syzygii]